ncbi:MAG: zinc-finger domain-containing protein [Rhodospirillaceae bacterium]
MPSVETITVDTLATVCDGDGALGHPRVYLSVDNSVGVVCPYCSRRFVLRTGTAGTSRGH